jgi:hypothetical protein
MHKNRIFPAKALKIRLIWRATSDPICMCMLHATQIVTLDQLLSIMVRERPVVHGGLLGGPLRSAGGFRRKSISKVVSDTERVKTTPIYVCNKTAFVVWLSTECRRNSSYPSIIILQNILN